MPARRRDLLVAPAALAALELQLALGPGPGSAHVVSGAAGVAVLALAVWRRAPGVVLGSIVLAWVVQAAAGGHIVQTTAVGLLAPVAASLAVGVRGERRRTVVSVIAAGAGLTLAGQLEGSDYSVPNDLAFFLLAATGGPAAVGHALGARARSVAELRERTRRLRAAQAAAAHAARAAEQVRLGREVHAAVAQRLGEIALQAGGATRCGPHALAALAAVEATARASLEDLRARVGALRAAALVADHPPPPAAGPPPSASTATSDREARGQAAMAPPAPRATSGGAARRTGRAATSGVGHAWWARARGLAPASRVDGAAAVAVGVAAVVEVAASGAHGPLALPGGVALGLPVALARRTPLLAALALLAVLGLDAAVLDRLESLVTPLAPALAVAVALGAQPSGRRGVLGLGLLWTGAAALAALASGAQPGDGLGATLVVLTVAWGLGAILRDHGLRAAGLRAAAAALERAQAQRAALAVAEERVHVARELHDAVGHALTVICLQAGAAQRIWDSDPARALQALEEVGGTARSALRSVRDGLAALDAQPPGHDLTQPGLETLAQGARAAGLTVDVHVRGRPRVLPPGVGLAAYRVLQEALTNAARHASPGSVRVTVGWDDGGLSLAVEDRPLALAGTRRASPGGGHGLRGMRERVSSCAGTLDAGPDPAGGFTVRARLPT